MFKPILSEIAAGEMLQEVEVKQSPRVIRMELKDNDSFETLTDSRFDENRNIKEYFNPVACENVVKLKYNFDNNHDLDPQQRREKSPQKTEITTILHLPLSNNNNPLDNNNSDNELIDVKANHTNGFNGTFAMRPLKNSFTPIDSEDNLYWNNNTSLLEDELKSLKNSRMKRDAKYSLDSLSTLDEMDKSKNYKDPYKTRGSLEYTTDEDRLNLLRQEKKNIKLREEVEQYRKLFDGQIKLSHNNGLNMVTQMKNKAPFSPISQNNEISRKQEYVHLSEAITRSNIEKSFEKPEIPPKPMPRKKYSTLQISMNHPEKNKSIESFQTIDPIAENPGEEMDEEDAEVYHYMSPQFNHRKILSNEPLNNHYPLSKTKISANLSNTDFINYYEKRIQNSNVIPKSEKEEFFLKLLENRIPQSRNNGSAFSLQKIPKGDYSTLPIRINQHENGSIRKIETAEAAIITPKPLRVRASQDRVFLSAEDNNYRIPYDYYPSLAATITSGIQLNFRDFIENNPKLVNQEYILKMHSSLFELTERDIDKFVIVSETVCAGYLWRMLPQNYTCENVKRGEFMNGRKRSVSVETSYLKNRLSAESSPEVKVSFGAVSDWDQRKYGGRSWAKRFFKMDTKRQLFVYYDNHTKTCFKNSISFADILGVDKYDENGKDHGEDGVAKSPTRGAGNFNYFLQESKNFLMNKFRRGNSDISDTISIFSRGRSRKVDLIIRTKSASMMLSAPNQDIANIWFELLRLSLTTLNGDNYS